MAKQSPAFKTEMADFEEKLMTTAAERKEEEATAQVQEPDLLSLLKACASLLLTCFCLKF